MLNYGGWYWFLSGNEKLLDKDKCGKWMSFFDDQAFAKKICKKAVSEGVCHECKCTDLKKRKEKTGVICFYQNGDDIENHRRIIRFMMENNLIPKTKAGRFYNISFKFDSQTRAGQYGADFEGKIRLDQFIDLKTGKWLRTETS